MNSSQEKPAIAPKKAPGSQIARQKRLAIMGFTMVMVIIPFSLYYLFFVTSQTTYFSKRNFRVLAGIGGNITSKIDNLATNLVNVVKKVECKDTSDTKNAEGEQAPTPIANTKKVAEAVRLVSDLKFDSDQYSDQYKKAKARREQESKVRVAPRVSNGKPARSNRNASPPAANTNAASPRAGSQGQDSAAAAVPATDSAPVVTLSIKLERGSFWLYPEYRGASSALPGILPVKSELKTLIEPLVERFVIDELNETRERLFDEVLVAEQDEKETGRVIFQRGPAGLTVVTLDSLLNPKGGKLELKLTDQSSSLLDVQIAGADYKLFLQPVRLTLSSSTDANMQGVRWVVCGLTRTNHFRDETFAVSYNVLIVFVFVVLLAVLSWPLLKLKLMGPKDRMRRFDLGLTLFSALMGMALVTFILLDVHASISLDNTVDHQLEDLSKKITGNFQGELRRALTQLSSINRKILEEVKNEAIWSNIAAKKITATAGGTPADIKAVQVVVAGFDADDKPLIETLPAFTVNSAGTVTGVGSFKTITSITIPAHDGTGATTSIGVSGGGVADVLPAFTDIGDQAILAAWTELGVQAIHKTTRQSGAPGGPGLDCSVPSWLRKMNILADEVKWETDTEKNPYPYFNAVTWTDSAGKQRIKWTTQNDTTALINVSDRQFFKNAKDRTLWKLSPSDPEYILEPIRSRNTGENIAVIATREPGSEWVSNLDTRLLSLMGPVLPAGYGFAVIDNNGKVMFHSDEVKNLEEQFFAECDNDRLRAAVISRTNDLIDTNYLGKGHRMHVSALAGMPWTLVTFADKRMARTMNLEVVTLSFVLYLLFALSIGVLISLICLPRMISVFSGRYAPKQGDRTRWLWPDRRLDHQYLWLSLSYVLIACVFVLVLMVEGGWFPAIRRTLLPMLAATLRWPNLVLVLIVESGWFLATCCAVLPMLAAGLWWLMLVWGPDVEAGGDESPVSRSDKASGQALLSNVRASLSKVCPTLYSNAIEKLRMVNINVFARLSYRTRYAIAFAGLLVLVSVLPAAGLFLLAQNFELRLMVKHGQVSIVKALEQRAQRAPSQYASIKLGDQKAEFIKRRLEVLPDKPNLDVYDSFFFATDVADPSLAQFDDEAMPGLDRLLVLFRPQYNQSCVESQGLAADASSDGLWRWKRDRKGQTLLAKDKDERKGDRSVVLTSSIPAIVAPDTILSAARVILSSVLLLLLVYALVRFVARRFFLLDVDLPPSIDFPLVTKLAGSRVLVWSPMTSNGNEWDREKYHVTDLKPVKVWLGWNKTLMSDSPKTRRSVVLNNFEHCMDDPTANREKLLAIEQLLETEKGVVVVSTVDPLNFSLPPKPAGRGAANNGDVKAAPSEPAGIEAKQNGASDFKLEYHGSVPVSVAIEGKQNGAVDVSPQALAFCLPQDIQARWTAAFTSVPTIFAADNPTNEFVKVHSEFASILKTKAPWRYIVAIGKALAETGTLPDRGCRDRAKIEELISQVVEQARSYHQSLWDTCSEGQRCTLIQLAQDGMISPKNKHLRLLVKRGLVVCDPPGLHLMDESFRLFVISVSSHQDVEGWRQQDGGSTWELMKAPLMLILVSVALFLFITQKDTYNSTLSFMSAITAGIAALFRLLGMFNAKDRGAGAIQN
jgi:hypothetical protein